MATHHSGGNRTVSDEPATEKRLAFTAGNFRSIGEEVGLRNTIELGPLTYLVGPNGAGKSALVDAIALLARLGTDSSHPFLGQLALLGGFQDLVHRQELDRRLCFGLASEELKLEYSLELAWTGTDVVAAAEQLFRREPPVPILERQPKEVFAEDRRDGPRDDALDDPARAGSLAR